VGNKGQLLVALGLEKFDRLGDALGRFGEGRRIASSSLASAASTGIWIDNVA